MFRAFVSGRNRMNFAVAVHHVFADLVVRLALVHKIANFSAQVSGEVHLRISDGGVETLRAAELFREPQVLLLFGGVRSSLRDVDGERRSGARCQQQGQEKGAHQRTHRLFALDPGKELALPDFRRHRAGQAVLRDAVGIDEEGFGRGRLTPQLIASRPGLSCAMAV